MVFLANCYKNRKMCNNAVDNFTGASEFTRDCYKAHKWARRPSILILMQ